MVSGTSSRMITSRARRDGLWTLREAAQYLRFSPEVIRRKCRDNALPHMKVFGRLRFRRSEVDIWLEDVRKERGDDAPVASGE